MQGFKKHVIFQIVRAASFLKILAWLMQMSSSKHLHVTDFCLCYAVTAR